MDVRNKQVDVLNLLRSIMESHNIPFWLFGGWGIDALLNEITREHDDIDILIPCEYVNKFAAAIEESDVKIRYWKKRSVSIVLKDNKVDCRFYIRLPNNDIALDLDESDPFVYPFPAESVDAEVKGTIDDAAYNVVTWDFHYIATEGYRYYKNLPLRKKDKDSLELINKNISAERKEQLKRYFPGIEKRKIVN